MIASLLAGMVGGAGVLGAGYGVAKSKLHQEPFKAIDVFFHEKEQNERLAASLSKKETELEKKAQALKERSKFLDKRYQEIVDDDESNRQIADYYNDLIQKENNDWNRWQGKQNPKKGEEPVLELVKRSATARNTKGYYKYLHDHRGALMDTQYGIYLELQKLLATEFSDSEYKPFVMELYRFLCRGGYNPYLVSWMLMTTLHSL
ncbi:hypothetical protein [Limosilactobacillus reuteri]|uniref:hypothetical protein n=1 Tax=Limosilactobacillus reuteri TaxID=1598 RepID=UPI001E37C4D5|nr:hypothetical protein [Limosilactobacillus reuteri]MCC4371770.1 hypothetical protein [Limosilactobacillus reuteri]MCC4399238.1 hypothetical protein [Limosilactobacillus reuteri]MCC4404118.1 hypothetical protein [Limosilactobacillus reuteri]MCC4502294.1 hypothetical protein [Limosilactobacillus reuteri]